MTRQTRHLDTSFSSDRPTRATATRRRTLALLAVGGATPWLPVLPAAAQARGAAPAWPARPVRLIVPFAAGGGNDVIGRFIATRLATAFGQPFVVENKPGAGGNLGTEQGLRSAPDGHTLVLIASSYSVNPAVYPVAFDPVKDVTPIVQIAGGPMVIVAGANSTIRSLGDLIATAKANPGKINFASSGAGGISHAAIELLAQRAGISLTHVPYKGNAPALNDTMAGTTDIVCSSISGAQALLRAGRLRPLAVTTTARSEALPDVPTVAESGVPGYDVPHWYGLIGPRGMPAPVVAQLNEAVNHILQDPEAATYLQRDGVAPVGGNPRQLGQRIEREVVGWRALAASGRFKVD